MSSSTPIAEQALPVRPRLGGMLHQAGFFAACAVGIVFVSDVDGRRLVTAAVFAASVAAMLGASALYHRDTWGPRARLWMRQVDLAGIFLLVAGTCTAVGLLGLHDSLQRVVLGVVWGGAGIGILGKVCWDAAPRWLSAIAGVAFGWVGVVAMPQFLRTAGPAAVALLAAGGIIYTVGALVYARRKPDPLPVFFGYHEVFHALTLVALPCRYVAIAFFVVRVG